MDWYDVVGKVMTAKPLFEIRADRERKARFRDAVEYYEAKAEAATNDRERALNERLADQMQRELDYYYPLGFATLIMLMLLCEAPWAVVAALGGGWWGVIPSAICSGLAWRWYRRRPIKVFDPDSWRGYRKVPRHPERESGLGLG